MLQEIYNQLEGSYDLMVELRRDFHMNPELSFNEIRTPKKIAEFYESHLGIKPKTGVGGNGVVAVLEGGKPGKTVALRADFDALPIQDQKDVAYKSKVEGVMHACGHDAHTSQLLVLAKVLHNYKDELKGNVVFIHQFAEEVFPGGAKSLIEAGCLEGVDAVFGTHVKSNMPFGKIGYREGATMASTDRFYIEVFGKGGHGAYPHETIDSIVIGSEIVGSLQKIVSRRIDPLHSAVVTVGSFHAGEAPNVIPDSATLQGTVRTFDEEVRTQIENEIKTIANSICEAAEATCEVKYERGYPSLWNHPHETQLLKESAQQVIRAENVYELDPIMGGEDFSYYLQHKPGAFFFTGAGNEALGAKYPHHHPKFDIDERAMLNGSKTLATVALNYLNCTEDAAKMTHRLK